MCPTYKFVARSGSLRIWEDDMGRLWLFKRKKKKHNNRRQRNKRGLVQQTKIIQMNGYTLKSFLSSLDRMSEQIQKKEKVEAIGKVMTSLQRPMKDVLTAVCEKQKKDVEQLYKTLGWTK